MKRRLMKDLIVWKDSKRRKPLILNGARQVGKTWLLTEFGRTQFENVAYVSLDDNPGMAAQFESGYDIPRILAMIQADTGERITAGRTLIILDEIQECPKALTSLKYFCENAREYHVAAAGSLLGLTVHGGTGYPVGKVNTLDLHPLSFREFLDATGNSMLREAIDSGDQVVIDSLSAKAVPLLKEYYFVGGMPEAVEAFLDGSDFKAARDVQEEILLGSEDRKGPSPSDAHRCTLPQLKEARTSALWLTIQRRIRSSSSATSPTGRGPETTGRPSPGFRRRESLRGCPGFQSRESRFLPTPTSPRSNCSSWMWACWGPWPRSIPAAS